MFKHVSRRRLCPQVFHWTNKDLNWPHLLLRPLATVLSGGPTSQLVGQCNVDPDEDIPRHVPICNSMRLANSSTAELRDTFLEYFRSHQHHVVSPASVFPKQNEGSYFINAGMNQFKPLFLSQSDLTGLGDFGRLRRATNCQPCIRVGGRLDDLNNVGYDRQHHTMFEMLGNWSFGDYYKEDACRFMWDFVTKVLGIPTNAIYVSYFGGCSQLGLPPDDETRDIWLNLGVLAQKLLPFDSRHNFWRAGQTSGAGLCGPSTELHVDFCALNDREGLRCARCLINTDSPQVVELWNSVFITHRLLPSTDGQFRPDLLEPLPRHMVDTGMGLERLACVMQGVTSTYDTDAFTPLMDLIRSEATTSSYTPPAYGGGFLPFCNRSSAADSPSDEKSNARSHFLSALLRKILGDRNSSEPSCSSKHCGEQHTDVVNVEHSDLIERWHRDTAYRLLADHSRALAHTLSDGLLPGRQGLRLKLRQLIQRATRSAVLTGLQPSESSSKRSVLASLVVAAAHRDKLITGCTYPALHGPSARKPSVLSADEMAQLIDQEVHAFLPKLDSLERSFNLCLSETIQNNRLSTEQVNGLMVGNYGTPVSWDMICSQSLWAGLCLPDVQFKAPIHPSKHHSPSAAVSIASQFHKAPLPHTDDSPKYHHNPSSSQHVSLFCESQLVGVVLKNSTFGEPVLAIDEIAAQTACSALSTTDWASLKLGLIFDRSNFHAEGDTHDHDTGSVSFGHNVLAVDSVQRISDPTCLSKAWLIHWLQLPEKADLSILTTQLWSAGRFKLDVNERRNLHLKQLRTGRNLLLWAMETHLRRHYRALPESTFLNVHSLAIFPDRCVVEVAMVDTDAIDWPQFTRQVESLCGWAIDSSLPVTVSKLDWKIVEQNARIRRYPWITYPNQVTTMCIEPPTDCTDSQGFPSIELTNGPHVPNTKDVMDLVITSVRGRQQVIKQFTAIVGEAARSSRLRAESVLSELHSHEAAGTTPSEQTASLIGLLDKSVLPFWARAEIESHLEEIRHSSQPTQLQDEIEAVLKQLTVQSTGSFSALRVYKVASRANASAIAHAVLRHGFDTATIVCSGKLAVCYFPNVSMNNNAVQLANRIVSQLNHDMPVGAVKSKSLRAASVPDSERSRFAVLELLSASGDHGWESYQTNLQLHASKILD